MTYPSQTQKVRKIEISFFEDQAGAVHVKLDKDEFVTDDSFADISKIAELIQLLDKANSLLDELGDEAGKVAVKKLVAKYSKILVALTAGGEDGE